MNQIHSGQLVSYPLLPLESSWLLMGMPGIATITFYQGNLESTAALLHKRLAALLKVNPWLNGRLEKTKSPQQLLLTYSRDFNEESVASEIMISNPPGLMLSQNQSYEELCKKVSACIVNKGHALLKNQEALIKLSLVPVLENSNDRFALIFSVSHIIADGYTFYALLNSLFNNSEPPILEPARELEASKKIPWAVGEKEYNYIFSVKYFLNTIRGFLFGKTKEIIIHYVDTNKINEKKSEVTQDSVLSSQDAIAPNAFISTNDILTSGFIQAVGSRLCLCAINLRNRINGIGFHHAGNYEAVLLFDYETGKTSQGIRKTLTDGSPFKPTVVPLPGLWEGIFCRMALITNWATFTGDLTLPDCKQILHLPLYPTPDKVPFDCAIVFEPNPGQTAMIVFAKRVNPERIREFCPFGESVFEKITE